MKLGHVLEARYHTPAIGPVKLWEFKTEGPGWTVGIEEGYDEDSDVYFIHVDGYTDEDCPDCDGSGEDEEGDECENCEGDGDNPYEDAGDQWQIGTVLGTKENVSGAHLDHFELEAEGEEAHVQVRDNPKIPQHLKDNVYK